MKTYDAIILGAGAAGLMCAVRAGQRGRSVLLLDHADQVGSKILISGGGRCNFTNLFIAPDRYLSENPSFCLSALKTYTQHDFIALVQKHGIAYHEKTLGQLFCDGSAREIVAMLLAECHAAGVEIKTGQTIQDVAKPDHFRVQTQVGVFSSSALVLGTGGLSIPKMGASGLSHRVAAQFGLPVTQTRPALVPLVFEGENLELMRGLSGLSLEIVARLGKQAFRESMIFTHRGLSGPAILQLSSYWREGAPLRLDLLPDLHADAFLIERKKSRPKAEVKTILGEVLPQRLAQAFSDRQNLATPIGGRSDKNLKEIGAFLKAWELIPSASEGYAKAEVTLGGVSTQALSSKTMQATHVPGLYVIGEAVDVTGWLGGYNFQWAWSSGWAAGSAV